MPPDVPRAGGGNDAGMSATGRISIEVETGPDGPSGTARDDSGQVFAFSGWLELIALIEGPIAAAGAPAARHDEKRETK